jgi:hypothetical protein
MSQPVWQTQSGSIGTYPAGIPVSIKVAADPEVPATLVTYLLISGDLPTGTLNDPFVLRYDGSISGTPENVASEKTSTFTIRAVDDLNNIRDRTFSLTISGSNSPKFTVPPGELLHTVDGIYVNYPIPYSNPIDTNKITLTLSSGSLPPGLYITNTGVIKGYPTAPIMGDYSPTTTTHTFSIQLKSDLGNDLVVYSISVANHQLRNPPNTRIPVILNRKPITEPIIAEDPLHDYYLLGGSHIPTIRANEFFSFKIIGHDFDRNDLEYQFSDLPPGLVGDSSTGWITGYPTQKINTITRYDASVSVSKKTKTTIISRAEIFPITVSNNLTEDIVWVTNSNLGVILNGTISDLSVTATASLPLVYRIVDGSLPPNLSLLSTGEIIGRVAEQPTETVLPPGANTVYNFTVEAVNQYNAVFSKKQTFTLTVNQYYATPLENVYLKASSSVPAKKLINQLLTDTDIIPYESLYRPEDPYYGKATGVKINHIYGLNASTLQDYVNAVATNHYQRKIVLGSIQTAVARDDTGAIVYEVVYSKLVDDLMDDAGRTLPNKVVWPRQINLRLGPWNVNNGNYKVSNMSLHTNLSPGLVSTLYPGSLQNMRETLANAIGQNNDGRLLPKWMTTQQLDSTTLGFVQAWVICYTKPGMSATIKNNIETMWAHSLNEIDFTIDRLIVDKSATYNWNTSLAVPAWNGLPSATPAPNPLDSNDLIVLFPRKTILPKEIE